MLAEKKSLPVWYFIGWLLLIYGILILGAGTGLLVDHPPSVTADSQIAIWWGLLLMAIGATYVYCFRPGRRTNRGSL